MLSKNHRNKAIGLHRQGVGQSPIIQSTAIKYSKNSPLAIQTNRISREAKSIILLKRFLF